jgi:hypothetical protein
MNSNAQNLRKLFEESGLRKDAQSSGGTIFSQLGLNAVNLEQEAKSLIPYNAPFLNSTPRTISDVGGLTVQWKAVLAASPGFVTLPEAARNQSADLTEKDYSAAFKSMGVDVDVSMFAQETGRGFQDNLGFAQFSALQMFLRAQDQQILCDGNSGPSGNGYALGTTSTPVVSASTGSGTITESDVTVYAVALTPFGLRAQKDPFLNANINATAQGLTPQFSVTNMTGATITASGGTAIRSAASNTSTAISSKSIVVTIPAQLGAVAYAIYISLNASPTTANAYFQGIYSGNVITITSLNAGVTGASNLTAAQSGLTTDYSYDVNAVDSYFAWTINWNTPPSGYSAYPSYALDKAGATLTAVGDGSIGEFSTIASFLYNNYKSAPDRILCASQTVSGTSLKQEIQTAILGAGSGGPGAENASRMIFDSKDGVLTAGTKQVAYEWAYSYDGTSKVITPEVMPWLPAGTIIFQTTQNPYPQAAGRIPSAFEVHSLLDTFSVVWPIRQLQRELGVYGFLATKNYLPHVSAVLQNVG